MKEDLALTDACVIAEGKGKIAAPGAPTLLLVTGRGEYTGTTKKGCLVQKRSQGWL